MPRARLPTPGPAVRVLVECWVPACTSTYPYCDHTPAAGTYLVHPLPSPHLVSGPGCSLDLPTSHFLFFLSLSSLFHSPLLSSSLVRSSALFCHPLHANKDPRRRTRPSSQSLLAAASGRVPFSGKHGARPGKKTNFGFGVVFSGSQHHLILLAVSGQGPLAIIEQASKKRFRFCRCIHHASRPASRSRLKQVP